MAKRKVSFHLSPGQLTLGSLALAVVSWAGFFYFTYGIPPALPTYPAFFAILFLAVTTTLIPLFVLIGRRPRSGRTQRSSLWRPVRLAMLAGLWVASCVWLQLVQLLNWGTALLLLAILALIEWFIASRK